MKSKSGSSGNVIFALFAAIGIVGALGATINSYIVGPLKTASKVSQREAASSQIDISLRVARKNALTRQVPVGGDCDSDGVVEPVPYEDAGANSKPSGGGYLPASIAGSVKDPWGTRYGYCVWDHGATSVSNAVPACGGATPRRLQGTTSSSWPSMMIVSAGPDRIFQTNCNAWVDANADLQPDTPLIQTVSGSDDVYQYLNYDNSFAGGSEIWALEGGDPSTAEIAKNISVVDGSATEQLSFNAASAILSLPDAGATGSFPTTRTNNVDKFNSSAITALDRVTLLPEDGSGSEYYFRNELGDALELYQFTSPTTYPRMRISEVNHDHYYYVNNANRYMRTRMNSYTGVGLRLSTNVINGGYVAGVEFTNPSYIYGYGIYQTLQISGGTDPMTSAIYLNSMLSPVASSTVPNVTGLYGDIRFSTRPLGQTAVDATALVERMRIRHDGRIQIGTISDRNFHVDGGNTIVTGRVGIGTDTPAAELHVLAGEASIRDGAEICGPSIQGAFRESVTFQCIETCDGVAWKCMGQPSCPTVAPVVGNFIHNVNSAASTLYTSNILAVTNTGCNNQFKIWGSGTPEYRLCTDATCSTAPAWQTANYDWPANATYYVQLRNTSPAAVGTKTETFMRLGDSYQAWILSVQASCGTQATPIGTVCADGTTYMGLSRDGYGPMYTTTCVAGQTWSGTACTGTANTYRWSTNWTTSLVAALDITGRSNTTYLAGLSNADAPYIAAQYCENLNQHGYTDWYLPARSEGQLLVANCSFNMGLSCASAEFTTGAFTSTEDGTSQTIVRVDGIAYGGGSLYKYNYHNIMCVRR
jgi:hypothetical protein